MSVDYQQMYRDIHDFVVEATGLANESVRPAYVNASAKPTQERGLLCSINLINHAMIGIDSLHYEDLESQDTDMDETVHGDRNVTASIKCYGEEALDTAEKIILYLTASAGLEFLNKKEIGYLRHGQILDISSVQNGSFESRRQIDIEFHVVTSTTNGVDAITSSEINFTYYGSEEITGTIEVNNES